MQEELSELFKNGQVIAVTSDLRCDEPGGEFKRVYYVMYSKDILPVKFKLKVKGGSQEAKTYEKIMNNEHRFMELTPDTWKHNEIQMGYNVEYVHPALRNLAIGKNREEGLAKSNEISDIIDRLSRNGSITQIRVLFNRGCIKVRITLCENPNQADIEEIQEEIRKHKQKKKQSGKIDHGISIDMGGWATSREDFFETIVIYNPKKKRQDDKVQKGFVGVLAQNRSYYSHIDDDLRKNPQIVKPNKLDRDIKRKIKLPRKTSI